jgi:hypothetical protein
MLQTLFFNNNTIFQDNSAPIHTGRTVQSWFEEHDGELQHLWSVQSPDLNYIEPLVVLKARVRNRFPPPASLKQLEDAIQEEWYKILLETVQNLYESVPRRITGVLKAEGGPTPN